jgi:type IV pilus assembly protein PilC
MTFERWVISHARVSSKIHKKIAMDDKMSFFQQLSTLVVSGTPLLQALRICSGQSQCSRMAETLEDIADRVASGSSFHAAAGNHKKVFEPHWIEIIRTGEITGQMGPILLELNKQIRDARETRRKIVGAMMYPIILLIVAITAITVMLWFVVPTFTKMFADMGAKLPAITEYVVELSNAVVSYGAYAIVAIVLAVLAFRKYMTTESGRSRVGGICLVLPMVGELMVQSAMYRFASNIALLLKSGIPMLETLEVLEGVFQLSPHYRDALVRVQGRVAAGRALAVSLEETGMFTSMVTNMVRIGEESGQLPAVMEQIAPYYKEKMEGLISKVTKLMEPIIIMGMGITIAGMMLAIYLPMFEMAGAVH